jgi:hypothetical protein
LSPSQAKLEARLRIDCLGHPASIGGHERGKAYKIQDRSLEQLDKAQGTRIRNERLLGENYGAFLKGVNLDLLAKVLPDPGEVFLADVGKRLFEKFFVFWGESEGIDELPHCFESSKDGVLSTEGVLPKEDLKGGFILMLTIEEIGVGTGELVEIVEEEIDLVVEVFSH